MRKPPSPVGNGRKHRAEKWPLADLLVGETPLLLEWGGVPDGLLWDKWCSGVVWGGAIKVGVFWICVCCCRVMCVDKPS